MILGHCIQLGSGNEFCEQELFYSNYIFKFIYSFHMPIFMLISGFLFANSISKDTSKNLLIKRFRGLIIPIFVWAIIPTMLKLAGLDDFGLVDIAKKYFGTLAFYLWFLWSLFYNSLVVIIAENIGNIKIRFAFYSVVFVAMFFVPDILMLNVYKFMLPYFVLGYYFKKKKWFYLFRAKANQMLLICLLLYLLLMHFYDYEAYIYTSGFSIIKNGEISLHQLLIDVYRYIVGIIGSSMILIFLYIVTPKLGMFIKKPILYIGRNTLGIYIVSDLCATFLILASNNIISTHNIFINFVELILILLFSIIITEIISIFGITRKLLLGSQK